MQCTIPVLRWYVVSLYSGMYVSQCNGHTDPLPWVNRYYPTTECLIRDDGAESCTTRDHQSPNQTWRKWWKSIMTISALYALMLLAFSHICVLCWCYREMTFSKILTVFDVVTLREVVILFVLGTMFLVCMISYLCQSVLKWFSVAWLYCLSVWKDFDGLWFNATLIVLFKCVSSLCDVIVRSETKESCSFII